MTTIDIKTSLHHSIDDIRDEKFLKAVYEMVRSFQDNEVVGSIGDKPLTRGDILKREFKADEDIKAGRVYSIDQVRERFGLKK